MAQQHIKAASQQAFQPIPVELLIPRSMQWFFLVMVALWVFAAMVLPVIAFCLTKDPLCFSLFGILAPPVYLWYRLAKHLFPMDEKTFELKKLRIQVKTQNTKNSP